MIRRSKQKRHGLFHEVVLVFARTACLQNAAMTAFLEWLSVRGVHAPLGTLVFAPSLLARLVAAYASFLYSQQRSYYSYLLLITGIQRLSREIKGKLQIALRAAAQWRAVEPVVHRIPMPLPLLQAMITLALKLGYAGVQTR